MAGLISGPAYGRRGARAGERPRERQGRVSGRPADARETREWVAVAPGAGESMNRAAAKPRDPSATPRRYGASSAFRPPGFEGGEGAGATPWSPAAFSAGGNSAPCVLRTGPWIRSDSHLQDGRVPVVIGFPAEGGGGRPPWMGAVELWKTGPGGRWGSPARLAGQSRVENQKPRTPLRYAGLNWVQGLDLNQRPSGYEPDELPGCSTLQ